MLRRLGGVAMAAALVSLAGSAAAMRPSRDTRRWATTPRVIESSVMRLMAEAMPRATGP